MNIFTWITIRTLPNISHGVMLLRHSSSMRSPLSTSLHNLTSEFMQYKMKHHCLEWGILPGCVVTDSKCTFMNNYLYIKSTTTTMNKIVIFHYKLHCYTSS